ncbi:dihydrolipoyllysine-residue acetyltransferase [Marinobacter nanhaiticus D15-8W]|uniref:Acetyltransferase component of pyruvate dehydrogenase complex n=1 Tax=Marinobacter nanhaiticus D15-8W TaxID=626887 RepID=N6X530_9GAMM|nr:dihydrolipoyllysine-residue acetyltransferase [Marinobacter nanhaiticus]ENO16168.1 dihydrolipoyllysine-residue acetyltransferase [Marinobacter nanhaiticus D15-8W]BES72976.1 dihydrolipoyllysine-residue acetyltransferase [Marinobacter nanhaiticus D15-8W]
MSEQEIKVPDLGGADEVEIIEITVSEGDTVEEEDSILTVESDKASVDLPSPASGKITKISVKVGDTLKEGDVVGMIETDDADDEDNADDEDEKPARDEDEDQEEDKDEDQDKEEKPKKSAEKSGGGSRKETVKVPSMDGAEDVPVIEINVQAGDEVAEEDPLVTVESDKATFEIPSPYAGKVEKVLVKEGDKLSEGDDLLEMTIVGGGDDEAGEETKEEPKKETESKSEPKKEAPKKKSGGGTRKETVKVPNMDGAEDVPVLEINVKDGDEVAEEDPLVTVESDKATFEIPSPFAGKVTKVLVKEGDKLSEGDDLLELTITEDGGEEEAETDTETETEETTEESSKDKDGERESKPKSEEKGKSEESEPVPRTGGGKVHAGPAVRKLAREYGVDMGRIKGSGPKDRILKDDIQAYVKGELQKTQEGGVSAASGAGIPGVKLPDFSQFGEVERESMSRIQVATANNMQRNWLNVPHVTQHDDADITDMDAFRKDLKAEGEKRGVKMTPLAFVLKACAHALAELPQFNVSLDMERKELVRKKYIHIGIAVDTPNGLMVPVIRDVDKKGLWELAAEAAELAGKARDKKLKPNEMQGGCFSITSLGGIGGTAFTPIVSTPEVAILGLSKASMKPVWDGKAFQPRLMMPLSLSYDHRAVNGADAARFTTLLSDLLGDVRRLLL